MMETGTERKERLTANNRLAKGRGSVLRRSRNLGMLNQNLALRINPDF